jgi:hypothetical protein
VVEEMGFVDLLGITKTGVLSRNTIVLFLESIREAQTS